MGGMRSNFRDLARQVPRAGEWRPYGGHVMVKEYCVVITNIVMTYVLTTHVVITGVISDVVNDGAFYRCRGRGRAGRKDGGADGKKEGEGGGEGEGEGERERENERNRERGGGKGDRKKESRKEGSRKGKEASPSQIGRRTEREGERKREKVGGSWEGGIERGRGRKGVRKGGRGQAATWLPQEEREVMIRRLCALARYYTAYSILVDCVFAIDMLLTRISVFCCRSAPRIAGCARSNHDYKHTSFLSMMMVIIYLFSI